MIYPNTIRIVNKLKTVHYNENCVNPLSFTVSKLEEKGRPLKI